MAKKIEIIGQSLVITDTDTSKVLFDAPKSEYYYKIKDLQEQSIINFYHRDEGDNTVDKPDNIILSDAVNNNNNPFNENTFQTFARENLGFRQGGGSGSGAVDSVNGKTGVVLLNASDIPVNSAGFDGNLSPSDNTIQKVTQKVDDLFINGLSGSLSRIPNISSMRGLPSNPLDNTLWHLDGYYSNSDGGEGLFIWNGASTLPDDRGSVIKINTISTGRFIRIFKDSAVSIEDFGAVADNSTDSTQAFLDARDYLISKGGGTLIIPNRGNDRFYISPGVTNGLADYSNITITGGGKIFVDENALGGGNSRGVFVKLADGTDNFKMYDLDFLVDADAVTDVTYKHGVICSEQVDDCTITNVWIEKVKIHSESRLDSELGNHGITFTRNSSTNQGTLDNITIRDCDIKLYGHSIYGIHLQMNGIYTTIEDNKVFLEASTSAPNEAYNAIAVYADREYTYISGNHAQGGHSSYAVSTSGKATIIGNWAYNCTVVGEAGFEFEYKGGHGTVGYQPEDVIISGNHSIGNYIGYLITDRINDATSKSPRNVILTNNTAKGSILSDAEITSSFGAGGDDTTRISNVILDGNFFLSSASEANIRSRDGSNLKIINNTCDGGSRAIKLGRNSNVKVRGEIDLSNNTLKNFNIGIEIETADNIDLSVNNNKAYGGNRAFFTNTNINASGESTMSFVGNLFKDQTLDALFISNSNVEGILINANTFIGAGDRGAQVTADNVIYTSNVSRGCTNNPQISGTGNVNQNNINI